MSQPEVFGQHHRDPYDVALTDLAQLTQVFYDAERAPSDWLIGIEYEMFGQIDNAQRPLPYQGATSITSFFHELVRRSQKSADPFAPILEGTNIVGLTCKRAVIALEPGGQIEIAARPHHQLQNATTTFEALVKDLDVVAQALGIELFAIGIHPKARREDMADVKKARYGIMRRQMNDLNGLGLDMMTRSCAIQINLDFVDENDMIAKTRLAACLVPFYSLLCTSSAFIDGKPTQFAIARGNVWRKTDPRRTGIPAVFFSPSFGYQAWINLVLDVPMYFIRRESTYHDARDASFRTFMREGLLGFRPTVRDFIDHMSTVFTDIRLKPILELRSADALPVPYVNALTALTWALLYDADARARAQDFFVNASHTEITTLHNDVIDRGRDARFRDKPVFEGAATLLHIARDALSHDGLADLLAPLHNLVARNITCTEWILAHFQPLDENHLRSLVQSFAPLHDPLRV